jgi:hypothetical protein
MKFGNVTLGNFTIKKSLVIGSDTNAVVRGASCLR